MGCIDGMLGGGADIRQIDLLLVVLRLVMFRHDARLLTFTRGGRDGLFVVGDGAFVRCVCGGLVV